MKKIGAWLVIINGIISITFGVLGILAARDIIELPKFLGDFDIGQNNITDNIKLSTSVVYGITIGFGLIEIILGWRALKNPRGITSYILLIIFGISIGINIWNCIKAEDWPISTIITLSISGIAFIGIMAGIMEKK